MDSTDKVGLLLVGVVASCFIMGSVAMPSFVLLMTMGVVSFSLWGDWMTHRRVGNKKLSIVRSLLLCPAWLWCEIFEETVPKPWLQKAKSIADLRFVEEKIVYPPGEANARSLSQVRMTGEQEAIRGLSLAVSRGE